MRLIFFIGWLLSATSWFMAFGQSDQQSVLDSLKEKASDPSLHDTIRADAYGMLSSKYVNIQIDTVEAICLEGIDFIRKARFRARDSTSYKLLLLLESILNNNAGYANYHMGIFDRALTYWYASLDIKERLQNPKGTAAVLNNIANLELDLGETEKAEASFNRIVNIQEEINDSLGLSRTLVNLGFLKRAQNNDSLALGFYSRALSIKKRIGDQQGLANCMNNIGYIHKKNGEYKTAIDYYNKSLKIYDSLGSVYGKLASLNNLANCYYELNQPSRAKKYAITGYKIASEMHMQQDLRHLTDILYKIEKRQGNYKSALNFYEEFVSVKDSLFSKEHYKALIDKELQYEYRQREKIAEINRQKEQELADLRHQNEMAIADEKTSRFQWITLVVGGGLIMVIILTYLIYIQLKTTRSQKKIIEKQNREIEMKALRAQMNPHFIFNSLNSIKNFIVKNESGIAAGYLSKFAKLMRLVLENSEKNLVTLEKELEGLGYYLELERLRFDGDFEYSIEGQVEQDFVRVPPLLLQPFVENAIWHGLLHKKDGKGYIRISIHTVENAVKICIEDNGVGRKKATELRSNGQLKKKSMGLNITQNRLKVLNELMGIHIEVRIDDLQDDKGKASGTRVILTIPTDE